MLKDLAQIAAKSPSVTTEPPTSVSTGTSTNAETATLNGTISPLGVSMVWYFEFDDDSDFTTGNGDTTEVQEVPGTPGTSSSATTVNVNYNATGLNHTKTYYYRTVGVATTGTGDTLVETYLYGVTKQFTYGAPLAPTISGITCGNTSLSVAFTAGGANGGQAKTLPRQWCTAGYRTARIVFVLRGRLGRHPAQGLGDSNQKLG